MPQGKFALAPDGKPLLLCALLNAPVAQLDRASDYGSEGLGFDSLRVRQFFSHEKGRFSSVKSGLFVFNLKTAVEKKSCPGKFRTSKIRPRIARIKWIARMKTHPANAFIRVIRPIRDSSEATGLTIRGCKSHPHYAHIPTAVFRFLGFFAVFGDLESRFSCRKHESGTPTGFCPPAQGVAHATQSAPLAHAPGARPRWLVCANFITR